MLGAGLPAHHSMFLKRSQLFDQHLLRDAGNALLQLASALRAIQQYIKNNNLPAPGDNIQRALDRQAQSLDDLHSPPLTKRCVDKHGHRK
jgi:hypothetical protein